MCYFELMEIFPNLQEISIENLNNGPLTISEHCLLFL